jgi:CMP/dCMP kinase
MTIPSRDGCRKSFVVAIDGPAASGKGTLARRLARRFGFAHLDTGTLYRATALLVLDGGGDPADPAAAVSARRINPQLLADPRLRGEAVASAASIVAVNPAVRAALLEFQRRFAAAPPAPAKGAVLDGRDIGSVVCPDAEVKLFITADVEERARRRVAELRERGVAAIYDDILQEMTERDARDTGRAAAPMTVAADATIIDTTMLDPEAVLARASMIVVCALAASR